MHVRRPARSKVRREKQFVCEGATKLDRVCCARKSHHRSVVTQACRVSKKSAAMPASHFAKSRQRESGCGQTARFRRVPVQGGGFGCRCQSNERRLGRAAPQLRLTAGEFGAKKQVPGLLLRALGSQAQTFFDGGAGFGLFLTLVCNE